MTRRYQKGCLYREKRKAGPDVWVFRFRDGDANRKEQLGTVEQLPTRSDAMKASEFLRSRINMDTRVPRTFGELVTHYQRHELPRKTPYTQEVYEGYLSTWILPKWSAYLLNDIKTTAVESWLGSISSLADGTKAKLRNLQHAVFNHAMRWDFFPKNPISLVRQSAKRRRTPEVLTTEEAEKLLWELEDPWLTAVYLAVTTGVRVSELLGLRWNDCAFDKGEINLRPGIVRQHIGEMKTEASRKPVPMDDGIAEVLTRWREIAPYNQDQDYIFGSPDMLGRQPYWPTAGMEDHIRPAALRAKITKRIGWHTFRRTFGTVANAKGADVATTKDLLRHANLNMTMVYVQAVTEAKREAQSRVVRAIPFPLVPARLTGTVANA